MNWVTNFKEGEVEVHDLTLKSWFPNKKDEGKYDHSMRSAITKMTVFVSLVGNTH